jgi:hypothetical protein
MADLINLSRNKQGFVILQKNADERLHIAYCCDNFLSFVTIFF